MSRTVEISEPLERRFRREAAAAGMSLEAFLLQKLETAPPSTNRELFEWLAMLPTIENLLPSAEIIRELRGELPDEE